MELLRILEKLTTLASMSLPLLTPLVLLGTYDVFWIGIFRTFVGIFLAVLVSIAIFLYVGFALSCKPVTINPFALETDASFAKRADHAKAFLIPWNHVNE